MKVEKGSNFFPEIGGWTFIGMQVLVASLVYLVAVPISLYLQFKNLEIYKEVYRKLLIGIFADTYYIIFMLFPLIKCIKQVINNKKQNH